MGGVLAQKEKKNVVIQIYDCILKKERKVAKNEKK